MGSTMGNAAAIEGKKQHFNNVAHSMEVIILVNRIVILSSAAIVLAVFLLTRRTWQVRNLAATRRPSSREQHGQNRKSAQALGFAQDSDDRRTSCKVARAFLAGSVCPASSKTVIDLLQIGDGAAKFLIPTDGRQALTYEALRIFLNAGGADLSRFGIGLHDRVALVIGNGAEAAVAIFGFSMQCAVSPLDPKLADGELEFVLSDLPSKAAVVLAEHAGRIGIGSVVLVPDARIAGLFTLQD